MRNLTLETPHANNLLVEKSINYRPTCRTANIDATLYRRVELKKEVSLTLGQLKLATWLFNQAGLNKPGWLRRKFYINQRRRKHMNSLMTESGLCGNWCGSKCVESDWSSTLHEVWHLVNERPSCK